MAATDAVSRSSLPAQPSSALLFVAHTSDAAQVLDLPHGHVTVSRSVTHEITAAVFLPRIEATLFLDRAGSVFLLFNDVVYPQKLSGPVHALRAPGFETETATATLLSDDGSCYLLTIAYTPDEAGAGLAFDLIRLPFAVPVRDAVFAGPSLLIVLAEDGTVFRFNAISGRASLFPCPGGVRFKAIAASDTHVALLNMHGALFLTGSNTSGACGQRSLQTMSSLRTLVPPAASKGALPGSSTIAAVACGHHHTLAVADDGGLIAFGLNRSGQCLSCPRRPDCISPPLPVARDALPDVGIASVAASDAVTVLISSSGKLFIAGHLGSLIPSAAGAAPDAHRLPGFPQDPAGTYKPIPVALPAGFPIATALHTAGGITVVVCAIRPLHAVAARQIGAHPTSPLARVLAPHARGSRLCPGEDAEDPASDSDSVHETATDSCDDPHPESPGQEPQTIAAHRSVSVGEPHHRDATAASPLPAADDVATAHLGQDRDQMAAQEPSGDVIPAADDEHNCEPSDSFSGASVHSGHGGAGDAVSETESACMDPPATAPATAPASATAVPALHRHHVCREILATEATFVASLDGLLDVYKAKFEEKELFPPETIAALCGGPALVQLRSLHRGFLAELQACEDITAAPLGELFLHLLTPDFATAAADYAVTGFAAATRLFDRHVSHRHFMRTVAKTRQRHQIDAPESLLITPIQRLPRYVMLLADLLRHTDAAHPDRPHIAEALKRVEACAAGANEYRRKFDMTAALTAVSHAIGKGPAGEALAQAVFTSPRHLLGHAIGERRCLLLPPVLPLPPVLETGDACSPELPLPTGRRFEGLDPRTGSRLERVYVAILSDGFLVVPVAPNTPLGVPETIPSLEQSIPEFYPLEQTAFCVDAPNILVLSSPHCATRVSLKTIAVEAVSAAIAELTAEDDHTLAMSTSD
jgi:hypothetical protein